MAIRSIHVVANTRGLSELVEQEPAEFVWAVHIMRNLVVFDFSQNFARAFVSHDDIECFMHAVKRKRQCHRAGRANGSGGRLHSWGRAWEGWRAVHHGVIQMRRCGCEQ